MQMKLAALCELPDAGSKADQLLSSYVGGSTHQQLTGSFNINKVV